MAMIKESEEVDNTTRSHPRANLNFAPLMHYLNESQ